MPRLTVRVTALAFAALVACGTEPQSPPSPTPLPTPTVVPTPAPRPGFDVDSAMEHVRALAVDIGRREAGSDGDERSASYIARELAAVGLDVVEQAFDLPQGGTSTNIVGTPPGLVTAEPFLLVGAHRDTKGGPGANDNATGIAAMIEIARALTDQPAPLPVTFVAFGAEELQPVRGRVHHVGSRFYVSEMTERARSNLVAMIDLDVIGRGEVITAGRMSVGPREATERILRVAGELGIAARERVTPDWSDNGSFLREGLNAGWLWTGDDPCCIHNEGDTIDRVRPEDLDQAGRLALAVVRSYESA